MATNPSPASFANRFVLFSALLAVAVGISVTLGWHWDISALKTIRPGWNSMKELTAISFLMMGIALLLVIKCTTHSDQQPPSLCCHLARFFCFLIALSGIASIYEFIDGAGSVLMAPESALSFILLSLALCLIGSPQKTVRRNILVAVNCALFVFAISLADIQSYLTPSLGSSGWFGFPIMAMHSAILFSILAIACIALNWQANMLTWSLSKRTTIALISAMVLLVFIGLDTTRTLYRMKEANLQIEYNENILRMVGNLQLLLSDAQNYAKGYNVSTESQHLSQYLQTKKTYLDQMRAFQQLVMTSPHQEQPLSDLETTLGWLQHWSQQFFDQQLQDKRRNPKDKFNQGEQLMGHILILFEQVKQDRLSQIDAQRHDLASVGKLAHAIIAAGTLSSLLILITVVFRFNFAVNKLILGERKLHSSNNFLQSLISHVPVRIFWKDRESRYLGGNTQFAADLNIANPAQLIGQTDFDLVNGAQAEQYIADDRTVLESGIPKLSFEETRTMQNGKTCQLLTSKIPLRNENDEIIGILGTYQDITELKLAEEKLRTSEERYRSLFENMLEGYSYCKMLFEQNIPRDFIYLNVNAEFEKITGLKNVIGKKVTEVIPGIRESSPELFDIYGRVILTGKPEKFESYLPGLNLWLSVTAYSQQEECFVAVFDNITERKQAEIQLKEQLDELHRWQNTTLGRETRTLELKREINQLLIQSGQPPRYPSVENSVE